MPTTAAAAEAQPLLAPTQSRKTPPWRFRWWIAALGSISLVALLLGFGYFLWRSTQPSGSTRVKWDKCGDNLYCGRFEVPLDYDNPRLGTASLYLVKYPHTTRKKQGTIWSNPGGPGASASEYNHRTGAAISTLAGGGYDIIGFDPRGVNFSTPRATCFQSKAEETAWQSTLPLRYKLPTHLPGSPNITAEERRQVFERELVGLLDRTEKLGRECWDHKDKKAIWNYMDTASNVRDIARMTDVFDGEGAPINYWGKSYGVFLGQYIINMYPERVGRVIIDAPADPRRWTGDNYKLSRGWFGNSEDTYTGFLEGCVAAGEACPLTRNLTETTVDNLRKKIDDKILELEANPVPVDLEGYDKQYYLTHDMVTELIFSALFTPRLWTLAARNLQQIFESNPLPAFLHINSFPESANSNISLPASDLPYAEYGVECSDTLPSSRVHLSELVDEKIWEIDHLSPRFAGGIVHTCDVWPKSTRAKKRFTGPWGKKLPNEVVLISVTADPMAPVEQTKIVQKLYKGQTRTIWQKGFGHCSPSQASLCTAKYIHNFLKNGKLPPREVECEVSDGNPWLLTKGLGEEADTYGLDGSLLGAMRSLGEADLRWR